MSPNKVRSQITFLYYDDIAPADTFYREIMGFETVVDHGWAKIYAFSETSFVGIVDGTKGFHKPQEKNAMLVTLVVDDVYQWYDYLKGKGVKMLTEVKEHEAIQVRGFFCEDPGGYTVEVQQFLDPETARVFHQDV
jgi:catechol 2,3-dioxygenase-like lactoylglutathione lyase family enzyme